MTNPVPKAPRDSLRLVPGPEQSDGLPQLVEQYLASCRSRGLSPKTVEDVYGATLRRIFLPWCEAQQLQDPHELTPVALESLAGTLAQRTRPNGSPVTSTTVRTYMKSIQQFLAWLQKQRGVYQVDSRSVIMPRQRRRHREVLTPAEARQLERMARNERNRLLIRVMLDTAAREGEVASIQQDGLEQQGGRFFFVRLTGKTGPRRPPIPEALYRRLVAYRSTRPRTAATALFLADIRDKSGAYQALGADGIYRAVRDSVQRAQLPKRCYPHLLRHTALTEMVARGLHPALISEIAGVSVRVLAEVYSHPTPEQQWKAMETFWEASR